MSCPVLGRKQLLNSPEKVLTATKSWILFSSPGWLTLDFLLQNKGKMFIWPAKGDRISNLIAHSSICTLNFSVCSWHQHGFWPKLERGGKRNSRCLWSFLPLSNQRLQTTSSALIRVKELLWQHTSACSLVPTGFKTSVVSSAWGTAEREAVMEMLGRCHWAHSTGGCGTREQGNSSTGGQWAGCSYQWWWRLLQDRHEGHRNPGCHKARTLMLASPRPGASRLTLGSSWSCSWPCKAPSGRGDVSREELGVDSEVAMGCAASPSPCTGVHCAAILPSTSHLHPASDHQWLPSGPHLWGKAVLPPITHSLVTILVSTDSCCESLGPACLLWQGSARQHWPLLSTRQVPCRLAAWKVIYSSTATEGEGKCPLFSESLEGRHPKGPGKGGGYL